MVKITHPANLNGVQLLDELAKAKIVVNGYPMVDGNGELWIDIDEADAAKAEAVALKHNGNTVAPEPTIADKLAAAGISLDDLKAALGI